MRSLIVCLLLVWAPCRGQEVIRLEQSGPAVPFAEVVWELRARDTAIVARVTKTFAADFGRQDEVGLLAPKEMAALWAELEANGVRTLETRKRRNHRTRWQIHLQRDGLHRTVVVDDPNMWPETSHLRIIEAIRRQILAVTDPLDFQDAMLEKHEAGSLRVTSEPTAQISLDGVSLGTRTPLSGLKVPAGHHEVKLESVGGLVETYEVTVEVGKTTSLTVELR